MKWRWKLIPTLVSSLWYRSGFHQFHCVFVLFVEPRAASILFLFRKNIHKNDFAYYKIYVTRKHDRPLSNVNFAQCNLVRDVDNCKTNRLSRKSQTENFGDFPSFLPTRSSFTEVCLRCVRHVDANTTRKLLISNGKKFIDWKRNKLKQKLI